MATFARRNISASGLALLRLGLVWEFSVLSQATPDQLIFGPQQYLHATGAPNQYAETFTVPTADSVFGTKILPTPTMLTPKPFTITLGLYV